jgi:glycosyltransferase involved in cell wall biosynthesis
MYPSFESVSLDAERPGILTEKEKNREAEEKAFVRHWARHARRRKKIEAYSDLLGRIHRALYEPVPPEPAPLGPSWEDRIYARDGIELLIQLAPWFEGTPSQIPFAIVVWDLQHRISPWFPEVGNLQEWQRRERSYSEVLRRAAIIYTGTDEGRQQIVTYYQVLPEQVKVLRFGAPEFARDALTRNDALVPALGIEGDYIFYPAQFWPHKNHVVILEACKIIRERTGWKLSVVFTGSDKGNVEYIRDCTMRLGLSDVTKFLGFVDRATLVELYRNAFCLVFPTFFGPDNLPPLEAFAIGCPVVASDVPGAREQLGDAALLFKPTEEQALAASILKLRDPAVRARQITAGREAIRRNTWEAYACGLLVTLDEFARMRRTWR